MKITYGRLILELRDDPGAFSNLLRNAADLVDKGYLDSEINGIDNKYSGHYKITTATFAD